MPDKRISELDHNSSLKLADNIPTESAGQTVRQTNQDLANLYDLAYFKNKQTDLQVVSEYGTTHSRFRVFNGGILITGSPSVVVAETGYFRQIVGGNIDTQNGEGEWWSILGGIGNSVTGDYSVIVGGANNIIIGDESFIGGGFENRVDGNSAAIVGGFTNWVEGGATFIGGGNQNEAHGLYASVIAGSNNTATGTASSINAGYLNNVRGDYSYIGAGTANQIIEDANYSAIVAGQGNFIRGGVNNFIGGGLQNILTGNYGTIGGGIGNKITGWYATIAGGRSNSASNLYSSIGGGFGNLASGRASTVAGGDRNKATGDGSFVGGGQINLATGQNSVIAGGTLNGALGLLSFIGGGEGNAVIGDYSAIVGGRFNKVISIDSIIGGGNSNWVGENHTSDKYNSILGGFSNLAAKIGATVGGGERNRAWANYATVVGGYSGVATGQYSTVLGGRENKASGLYSVAAGYLSEVAAGYSGAVVLSDGRASAKYGKGVDTLTLNFQNGVYVSGGRLTIQPKVSVPTLVGSEYKTAGVPGTFAQDHLGHLFLCTGIDPDNGATSLWGVVSMNPNVNGTNTEAGGGGVYSTVTANVQGWGNQSGYWIPYDGPVDREWQTLICNNSDLILSANGTYLVTAIIETLQEAITEDFLNNYHSGAMYLTVNPPLNGIDGGAVSETGRFEGNTTVERRKHIVLQSLISVAGTPKTVGVRARLDESSNPVRFGPNGSSFSYIKIA